MHRFADSIGSSLGLEQVKSPGMEKDDRPPIYDAHCSLRLINSLIGFTKFGAHDYRIYQTGRVVSVQERTPSGDPLMARYEAYRTYPLQFPPLTAGQGDLVIVQSDPGFIFNYPDPIGSVFETLIDDGTTLSIRLKNQFGPAITYYTVTFTVEGSSIDMASAWDQWASASISQLPLPIPGNNSCVQRKYYDGESWIEFFNAIIGQLPQEAFQIDTSCQGGRTNEDYNVRSPYLLPITWIFIMDKIRMRFSRQGRVKRFKCQSTQNHVSQLNPLFPIESDMGCDVVVVAPEEVIQPDLMTSADLAATYFDDNNAAGDAGHVAHKSTTLSTPPISGVPLLATGAGQNYTDNGLPAFHSSCS